MEFLKVFLGVFLRDVNLTFYPAYTGVRYCWRSSPLLGAFLKEVHFQSIFQSISWAVLRDVNLTFYPAYIYGGEVLLAGQADIGWRWQVYFQRDISDEYFDEYF